MEPMQGQAENVKERVQEAEGLPLGDREKEKEVEIFR